MGDRPFSLRGGERLVSESLKVCGRMSEAAMLSLSGSKRINGRLTGSLGTGPADTMLTVIAIINTR